ncbi:tripartite tricarboxylate transporter substrate binding protein [Orrella sp. JC864]|uniref:Bug family tripartite tricarboxylate transporter substrate binding protein n=1 Tax=Orrella sp. JC864 TaxID=3120298 RepID=UPI00300BBFA9
MPKTFKLAAAVLACAVALGAAASEYPQRPITMVSPFPPGGATDVITRAVAKSMGASLGQPVVVVNRPGAGTTIGGAYAAAQPADGYTLLMATNTTIVGARFLYKDLRYDPDRFEPVGIVGTAPMVLLSAKARGFRSTDDALAYARQHGQNTRIASQGPGTLSHLLAECLQSAAGLKMSHIPYKGTAEAMPALINGDVDLFYDTVGTGMTQAQGGTVDVLHATGPARMSTYPDVPTVAQAGVKDCQMQAWWTLVAPAGTPEAVLARLRQALQETMQHEEVRRSIASAGTEPADGRVQGYREMVSADVEKTGDLIERAGITLQ